MLQRSRLHTGITQISRQALQICRSSPRPPSLLAPRIRTMASGNSEQGLNDIPSEKLALKQRLDEFGLDKWNFVVYRCSYRNEKLWTEFKDVWIRRTRRHIAESDAPDLLQSLDWTFFDDARNFRDASKDDLRRHFKAWASSAPAVEQPRAREPWRTTYSPRYRFFIHVDHEAMQSVVEHPEAKYYWETGHVNLVDSKWGREADDPEDENEESEFDRTYPPIDGCTSQEVGWTKLQSSRVAPEIYNLLSFDDYAWYDIYVRPPDMLPY